MHKLLEMGEPDQLQLLRQRVEELESELEIQREKVQEARSQSSNAARALSRLRTQLQPWYSALRGIMGELDTAGVQSGSEDSPASSGGPLDPSRYAPWKEKFRGQTATAIDILVKYEVG